MRKQNKMKSEDKDFSLLDENKWDIEVKKQKTGRCRNWVRWTAVLLLCLIIVSLVTLFVSGFIFRVDVLKFTKMVPVEPIPEFLVVEHMERASFGLITKSFQNGSGNYVWSPIVTSLGLAVLVEGVRGKTANQIYFVMDWKEMPITLIRSYMSQTASDLNQNIAMNVANGLFVQKQTQITSYYKNILKDSYGGDIIEIDFSNRNEAQKLINDWSNTKSQGDIVNLVPDGILEPMTNMVLSSLLTFHGKWKFPFNADHTQKSDFMLINGKKTVVDMMYNTGRFLYGEFPRHKFLALILPYEIPNAEMVILLPPNVSDFKKTLIEDNGGILIGLRSKMRNVTVDICLPKFKINTAILLDKHLSSLGIRDLFNPSTADLGGISSSEDLYIKKIFHQVEIEVNERGTTGKASQSTVIGGRSLTKNFCAERPFIFYVQDLKHKAILFWGEYNGSDQ